MGNNIQYKTVNGTSYNAKASDEIISILENARQYNKRVRLFYGNTETGRDWMEVYDTMGTIGRSYGEVKIPLLIKNSRSIGGSAILEDCIVKITIDKKVVYQHENYSLPTLEIVENKGKECTFTVLSDGVKHSRHKTLTQAENRIEFIKGLTNKYA